MSCLSAYHFPATGVDNYALVPYSNNSSHSSYGFILVDYILMDPDERKRLFIHSIPRPFPQRVIRAPVPWHNVYQEVKCWNEKHLFMVNPMMLTLQQLWFTE